MGLAKKYYRCPCCGTPMKQPGVDRTKVVFGPRQQALFNVLKACPDGLSVQEILERIGGNSINLISVMAHHINRKIAKPEPLGWGIKIKATGGIGSVYRLVKL